VNKRAFLKLVSTVMTIPVVSPVLVLGPRRKAEELGGEYRVQHGELLAAHASSEWKCLGIAVEVIRTGTVAV
jgi:hypothetical protein